MITGLHTFASAKPLRALERPATVMYTLGCFFASYLCGSACGYYNYLKELQKTGRGLVGGSNSHLTGNSIGLARYRIRHTQYLHSLLNLLAMRQIALRAHENNNKRSRHG